MVGDGRLAYAAERVLDVYYAVALGTFGSLSLEAQRFESLAFNHDRGPATLYGLRLHLQL
jgi:high affinity Mn2+ porin